jgi:aspartyl-tRNA(Asn)/glutamyl-tRNA(Gln) amidotransferase subunit A
MASVDTSLLRLSAGELVDAYAARRTSPVEVTRALLRAARAAQDSLNCFVAIDEPGAARAAELSEKRWLSGAPLSALDGVPVSLKDNLDVAGLHTRYGSLTTAHGLAAERDCPAAARLREAGAILFAKTTTPEFAHKMVTNSPLTGVSRNPWNLQHSPGGSSGGAAAAVCAGLAPVAIGTDGAGSIRIPAAWTATFGFKPSLGRVPHHPRGPLAWFSHVGPICRSVSDAARVMTIISRPDARDWYSLPFDDVSYEAALTRGLQGVRIAFSPALGLDDLRINAEISSAVERAGGVFEALGATVELADPPFMQECIDTVATLFLALSARLVAQIGTDGVDPSLVALAELGGKLTAQSIIEASVRRGELGSVLNGFFERFDLLLAPVTQFDAPALSEIAARSDLRPMLTQWCNLLGFPAASVCCGFSSADLPIGVQVIGRRWADVDVLRACHAYELERGPLCRPSAHPWATGG